MLASNRKKMSTILVISTAIIYKILNVFVSRKKRAFDSTLCQREKERERKREERERKREKREKRKREIERERE